MTTIDDTEFEKATLMPNRWYIILRKIDEESFAVSAYDTTTIEDEEFYEAGTVVTNGIMELLETDFDKIMESGLARLMRDVSEGPSIEHEEGTNVVKIDFGRTQ